MKIFDKNYVDSHKPEILEAIKSGKIFIYPTDTIYGIGCNALLKTSVNKIREIKKRESKPFSVIAPNKNWILENCFVSEEDLNKYLPGPHTLFVKRKKDIVAKSVNPSDKTLGIRIPKHWFAEVIAEAGVPFVTTSVNLTGEPHMQKIEDIPESIKSSVDYCIYEGEIDGKPSTKIDLTKEV